MRSLFILVSVCFGMSAWGSDAVVHHPHFVPSKWNFLHIQKNAPATWNVQRPFSEIEETGYVAISGDDEYELADLRLAIVKNLPADAAIVIYIDNAQLAATLKTQYQQYLGSDRLKFLLVPSGEDEIWGRDALPFPVYMKTASSTGSLFGLVDSLYPQSFEPDAAFATALSLPMTSTKTEFRGGNLLMDLDGNCYAENVNEVGDMSDAKGFFQSFFGCASVTLLAQAGGIGDLDERVKFLTGKDVLTDNDGYATILQANGYTVHRIPTTGSDLETYMNTLIVNGTIFVPQMGIANDAIALQAYRDLGFNPIGVNTKQLADQDNGNIHCLTMNYPKGTFTDSGLGEDFVEFK